jgi:hypothetical protein
MKRSAGVAVWLRCSVGLAATLALVLTGWGRAQAQVATPTTAPGAAAVEAPSRAGWFVSPIGSGQRPADPWTLALLPRQTKPETRFDVVALDGERVLRVRADDSYGNLVHGVPVARTDARTLHWSWRVDIAPDVDLRTKEGDDVALKVCALYDWPRDHLPLGERAKLAAASAVTGTRLPSATLCWVADTRLPEGTWLPNAYTARLRMLVVQQFAPGAVPRWSEHRRDLHADFRRAFADEWRDGDAMPPLLAVLIGADADNTRSQALGYVRSIDLR